MREMRNENLEYRLVLLFVSVLHLISCNKEPENRFPLAEEYNIDGEHAYIGFR